MQEEGWRNRIWWCNCKNLPCLELIAHIKLQNEYGIDTSNVDLKILKEYNVYYDFDPDFKGNVKISLIQDYKLLNDLEDELGKFNMEK